MSTELTAEQKLRQIITGDPFRDPDYLHEGPEVVRWLTGGTLPDVWVTFHPEGEQIACKCAGCQNILGYLSTDSNPEVDVEEIGRMRLSGHENHMPEGWPAVGFGEPSGRVAS